MLKYRADFSPAVEYIRKDGSIAYLVNTKLYDSLAELFTALAENANLIHDPRCIKFRTFNVKEGE